MFQSKSLAQMALVTALICVLGFLPPISLGVIPVPIVLQNMGVMLAAALLGGTRGSLSVLLFLMIGLVLPVFTGGNTTLPVLTGPTAGYVVAWLAVPLLYEALTRLVKPSRWITDAILLWLASIPVVYLLGVFWLRYFSDMTRIDLLLSNLIFVPGDTIKVIIATVIARRLIRSRVVQGRY
ncbi:biotin transporter BioY [Streptococcus entericus]|uniref:biotin transporter BioY n=1 Tax=Streptococcus entericus TaxID=155680 RepID=UPI0003686431|nr:biotin transporter BioY [Streptococcus entericus]